MRIPLAHRSIFMVAAVTLFVPQLVAQTVGNLYGGYSFLSNDLHIEKNIGEAGAPSASGRANLNGWNVSAEVKLFRWIGAVADFDGSYGSVPITGFTSLTPQRTATHLSIPICLVHVFRSN